MEKLKAGEVSPWRLMVGDVLRGFKRVLVFQVRGATGRARCSPRFCPHKGFPFMPEPNSNFLNGIRQIQSLPLRIPQRIACPTPESAFLAA